MPWFARPVGAAVLAFAAVAVPASAQTLRVAPQIGVFANARNAAGFDASTFLGTDKTSRSPRPALGLAVEVTLPVPRVALRAGGVYGFESSVPVLGVVCLESPCTSVRASTLAAAGDVVLDVVRPGALRAYVLGGLGLERWRVNREVGGGPFVESETRLARHFGGGLEMAVGRVGMSLEVTDFVTGAADAAGPSLGDTRRRHGVFVMLGASFRR